MFNRHNDSQLERSTDKHPGKSQNNRHTNSHAGDQSQTNRQYKAHSCDISQLHHGSIMAENIDNDAAGLRQTFNKTEENINQQRKNEKSK